VLLAEPLNFVIAGVSSAMSVVLVEVCASETTLIKHTSAGL